MRGEVQLGGCRSSPRERWCLELDRQQQKSEILTALTMYLKDFIKFTEIIFWMLENTYNYI